MILHVDMDAFYASIEERDAPALRGKPMVVGGAPRERGVVAAANYAARRYGVHSAMPMARALRLCPALVVRPVRHDYYAEVSRQIFAIFHRYTPLVEPLSLDEAFLDVTRSRALFGEAADIGRRIKGEIKQELQLTASVGVAPNKFLAKVASDVAKPDGFVVVEPDRVQAFLDPLPVSKLWGVGKVANRRLEVLGVHTIGDLRRQPRQVLDQLFGRWGEQLRALAHGIDDRPVIPDHEAKSISHETTFAEDVVDPDVLRGRLLALTEQVARRLRRHRLRGRTVQIKIRFADFKTITRERTLASPTDVTRELWRAAETLLARNVPRSHRGVRLLGVGVSGLETGECTQPELFTKAANTRHSKLDDVSDRIQGRFGTAALRRATHLKRGE